MFFFYGWGTKAKPLDLYTPGTCGICHRDAQMQVIIQYDYFSLFFIPIIKWNKRYYLQCPHCEGTLSIDKQTYLNIKNGVLSQTTKTPETAEDPFDGQFEPQAETAPVEQKDVAEEVASVETAQDEQTQDVTPATDTDTTNE